MIPVCGTKGGVKYISIIAFGCGGESSSNMLLDHWYSKFSQHIRLQQETIFFKNLIFFIFFRFQKSVCVN